MQALAYIACHFLWRCTHRRAAACSFMRPVRPKGRSFDAIALVKRLEVRFFAAWRWGMMCSMETDWKALGRELAARRELLGFTQEEAGAGIGASRGPIQTIERGVERKKITATMRTYARLLGWTDDSIDAVLAGGKPTIRPDAGAPGESPRGAGGTDTDSTVLDELPLRIQAELGEGRFLDARSLSLEAYGAKGARAVVIVRAAPGASAAEQHRALEAWRRAEADMERMGEVAPDDKPGA
ncbi:helix-turn-helix domain-containing protein [Streptomyces sp. NPDC088354]|uniref:helix-turn-helix domain-containing protein n=1 Tax=Streptomyces sp. NPDC088354 TaxID=3365856 RepID=UPI0038245BF9